jgi:hypothetical protein
MAVPPVLSASFALSELEHAAANPAQPRPPSYPVNTGSCANSLLLAAHMAELDCRLAQEMGASRAPEHTTTYGSFIGGTSARHETLVAYMQVAGPIDQRKWVGNARITDPSLSTSFVRFVDRTNTQAA